MSLMGQGIKNIADAKGHGNFSNRHILHIAELFAYQFPSDEIRKTGLNLWKIGDGSK